MQTTSAHRISLLIRRRLTSILEGYTPERLYTYLADTIYQERRRCVQDKDHNPQYDALLTSAAKSLKGTPTMMTASIMQITDHYIEEIHTHFDNKTYDVVSKFIPGALTRLLTATHPLQLLGQDFDPASRLEVQGPIEQLKRLSEKHTLVFTPTHVSNLDSPLIGYALQSVGLPPVLYGAGLNLFSNPFMAFFLGRLGAYTVDRRKKNILYKDVLKLYSTVILELGYHSLFYPGGTRSRDGRLETGIKKGLLGTALQAWQNNIEMGSEKEVLIVPCTISSSLVLEAETLIDDALAETGKSRYIISDDEFSERSTMATFTRKVLSLDASIYIRFSTPLDCVGNLVNHDGVSLSNTGEKIERRDYICDKQGQVIVDEQRDMEYTKRLASKISEAYARDSVVLSTHLVARAAWLLLKKRYPNLDQYQLALLEPNERILERDVFLKRIEQARKEVLRLGIPHALPSTLEEIAEQAYKRFALFHRDHAVIPRSTGIEINPKLALYYGNRLAHLNL